MTASRMHSRKEQINLILHSYFKSFHLSLGTAPLRPTFFMELSKQLDGITYGFYSYLHKVRVVLSKGLELFPVRRFEVVRPFAQLRPLFLRHFPFFHHTVSHRHACCARKWLLVEVWVIRTGLRMTRPSQG